MKEKEYVKYLTPEELTVMYENLTIKDDFIFGKVMENKENCVGMLERLTGNRISDNVSINKQKAVKIAVDGKGVRYDVYVEDDARVMYDAEMQQSENKAILPKRSRFYQGLMDFGYLEVEDEYTEQLQGSVALARHNKEWRVEYMKTFVHDIDVRREGIEIGKEIGRTQGNEEKLVSQICKKLKKQKTAVIIAEELEEDIDKVRYICEMASGFAPEFNVETVWQFYIEQHQ